MERAIAVMIAAAVIFGGAILYLVISFVALAIYLVATFANAFQPPTAIIPHDHSGEVGKFYETWKKPNMRNAAGQRIFSCCNKSDCAPVEIVIKNGSTYVRGHFLSPNEDVHFPDYLHEHNQPDARESPDGRNHACLNASGPLCLVLGIQS